MVFLDEIIKDIEIHYEIQINRTIIPHSIINGVRFLNDKDIQISHLLPNTLYLADYKKYGYQVLNGTVLYVHCEDSIPYSSMLYIKEDLDIIDIFNVIENRFSIHNRVETQIKSLFNTLHNGSGIETTLKKAYLFLDNPIVICDNSYSVLASYPEVEDERNLVFVNGRLSVKTIFSNNMLKNKIIQQIYHSFYPFVVKVEDFPYDWVFESIRIKRAVVGYICIRCINRPLGEYELDYIHALSRILSVEMQKDDTYNNPYGIKYDIFLKELFNKQLDRKSALQNLELIGVKPKKYYYIITTAFISKSYKLMNSSYYIQQFTSIFKNSITGIFGNRYVTLVSTDEFCPFDDYFKDKLNTFLKMNHMLAAFSYRYSDLWNSSTYAAQSQALLTNILNTNNENPIAYYHDFYLKHVIQLIDDTDQAAAFIHPSIIQMKEYDQENNTEYFNTLVTFFDNNRNAPATAQALYIHKSTLFYRFKKMKQLFSIDLDYSYALFTYEFSINLIKTLKGTLSHDYDWFS